MTPNAIGDGADQEGPEQGDVVCNVIRGGKPPSAVPCCLGAVCLRGIITEPISERDNAVVQLLLYPDRELTPQGKND